jgi:glycosyltransferase involved in cell wall biosynthesis
MTIRNPDAQPPLQVAVIDMQPITPAVGGGRLRLLGLYHNLGPGFRTTYVGSYDWPGERFRECRLTDSLTEIDEPLSREHFAVDADWRAHAGGATVTDVAFPILGRLSDAFLGRARSALRGADIVIFSHPWTYPHLADDVDRRTQFLVYDSQNAEALLKSELLGGAPFNAELAKCAAMAECFLVRAADLVIGCSTEDIAFFSASYRAPDDRFELVPNGVFVERIRAPSSQESGARKSALELAGPVAIFLGSDYGPNRDAARFIVETLAPALPWVTFAICGGVGRGMSGGSDLPVNVRAPGILDDEQRLEWLQAADVALNPMFSGSGTNIKMFDYMAAGLPVVATPIGARGIAQASREGILVCPAEEIGNHVSALLARGDHLAELGQRNRRWVEEQHAWERLSPALGDTLRLRRSRHAAGADGAAVPGTTAVAMKRSAGVGHSTGASGSAAPTRIAILSTYGIKCGIAEYASYLADALRAEGASVQVFGNRADQCELGAAVPHASGGGIRARRLWHYDRATPARSEVDLDEVSRVMAAEAITHLNVQYHRAFFSERVLLDLTAAACRAGGSVSITLHNSSDSSPEVLAELGRREVLVLVHNRMEEARLRLLGIRSAHYLPQGVRKFPGTEPGRLPSGNGGPVIATFGFLRPHKGLLELLTAFDMLRKVFPDASLVAQTALYPSTDSSDYLAIVQGRIEEIGLRRHVAIDTRFLPIDDAVGRLAESDVVVLPYALSDEGSSAAAAAAVAARRPIVATMARIFDDIRHQIYSADSNEPPALAVAIATVCANPPLRRHLEALSARAAAEREWSSIARRFLRLVESGSQRSIGAA